MKTAKMLTILVIALGLMVWSAPIVHGAQYLTVNGQDVTSISLELGQSRTVEVVSTDGASYVDYVGFDNGAVLGAFSHLETKPEAGNLSTVVEYDQPAFYGYYVNATGISPAPSPGVHFVFKYIAQQVGETDLKLYDSTFTTVVDSVHITVIPLQPLPMGTAFTYQGHLMDSNSPANGLYDFEFKLFDNPDPVFAAQQGNTIDINDLDVIDGQFTLELDFGSDVFNGDARWLEVSVRPGDSTDPNDFVTLSPRQEVTPMPYALQTRGIFVDDSGNVGIGTTSPVDKLHVATEPPYGDVIFFDYGGGQDDLSIDPNSAYTGNTDRIYIVEVTDSEDDIDKFKWSDDNGVTWSSEIDMTTSWYDLSHGVRIKWDDTEGHFDKDRLIGDKWTWVAYHGNTLVVTDGNVGIGTTNPSEKLDVEGNIDVSSNQIKNYYGFPRPDYDSGWVPIAPDSFVTLTHNLGGNVDNYVVNMQFKGMLGIHCHGYGHDRYNTSIEVFRNGAYYRDLKTDTIRVSRYANDLYIEQVRIRIWMYD